MSTTAFFMAGRLICQLSLFVTTLGLLELGPGLALARSWPLSSQSQPQTLNSNTQRSETADLILAQDLSRPTLRSGSVGDAVTELQAILKLLGFYDGPVDGFYRESTQAAVGQFQTAVGIAADGIVGPGTWQKLLPNPGDVPTADIPEPAEAEPVAATPQPAPATTAPAPAAPPAAANPAPPAANPAPASPPESSTPQPVAIELPVLRQGMFGPAVTRLQERLTALGAYKGPIDGIFGSQTAAAVEQIQRQHDLTVDGIVGPVTWSIIFK